ncbi:MAG: flagellar biosynthesis anti-sigma factor FlgM [Pseudohongiellaceae bacterium]
MMRKAIAAVPVINASKVVALHSQIMTEEYQINPQHLAENILRLEAELYKGCPPD